jgi:hypothetical protein
VNSLYFMYIIAYFPYCVRGFLHIYHVCRGGAWTEFLGANGLEGGGEAKKWALGCFSVDKWAKYLPIIGILFVGWGPMAQVRLHEAPPLQVCTHIYWPLASKMHNSSHICS